MTATPDPRMVGFVAEHHWGVLVTIKRDGRPQLSNVGYFMDAGSGLIRGTPEKGTPEPVPLVLRASDGSGRVARATRLVKNSKPPDTSTHRAPFAAMVAVRVFAPGFSFTR